MRKLIEENQALKSENNLLKAKVSKLSQKVANIGSAQMRRRMDEFESVDWGRDQ